MLKSFKNPGSFVDSFLISILNVPTDTVCNTDDYSDGTIVVCFWEEVF